MTREETIHELGEWLEQMIQHGVPSHSAKRKALATAIALLSAEAEQTVYCIDCAKSVPLDEHGALWYCKAHDRTTLGHSYCNNGERQGGDEEPGQWQTEDGKPSKAEYSVYCSKCGSWSEYRTKYCGNCGSLMKEENDVK